MIKPFAAPKLLKSEYDVALLWTVLALLAIGIVMVYSASIASAEADRHIGYRSSYYFIRQLVYVAVGMAAASTVFQLKVETWQRLAPYLFFAVGLPMLVFVLVPGIGKEVNGSRRWISLILFNIQPSEFMKFFVVLYAADYTVRKAAFMHSLSKGFFPMGLVMILVGFLLLREPDFGALAVMTAIAASILFLGGLNWRLFVFLMVILATAFVFLVVLSPYRFNRLIWFWNPWADPFGKGYQLTHALIAFGHGGWFGVGLGASVEKQLYLPEAHTDFLMAVIAEELGFLGVFVTLALFVFLVWRSFSIGRRAAAVGQHFGALAAQGVGVWLAVQTIVNVGVNMGMLPTKGLTLPLLSYGGSGIVANLLAVSMLMRIDYELRLKLRGRAS